MRIRGAWATIPVLALVCGVDCLLRGRQENQARLVSLRGFPVSLERQVEQFDAGGRSLAEVAVDLAYSNSLPMAFEHADPEILQKPIHIKLERPTLRQILTAAVGSFPNYRVDFSQGLVDIYSTVARRDPTNPLNTLVPRYDVAGLDTHLADAQLLCAIPPIQGCGGSVAGGQWGPLTITLHLRHKRVYEILNAIVAQNGHALWIPLPWRTTSDIRMNFWYIYPLDPPFKRSVLDNLQKLLPQGSRGADEPLDRARHRLDDPRSFLWQRFRLRGDADVQVSGERPEWTTYQGRQHAVCRRDM
jgi:hypothetical protein